MKRLLLLIMAVSFLLFLAACSDSEDFTTENPQISQDVSATDAATEPIEESQATQPADETIAPTEEAAQPTEETTPETEGSKFPYLVKIVRADFPIYSGPSYDDYVVGTVEVATVYTIVDEVLNFEGYLWGKLKSGAGWVDLSLNQKETNNMPPITVSRAGRKLLEGGNYYYCRAEDSEYAYEIAFSAHDYLSDVSFFSIDAVGECTRGPELFHMAQWNPGKPFVASVSFPGPASLYGLEFTDSDGVTHVYSVWESGRNGSVGVTPFKSPFASPAPETPEPEVTFQTPSIPDALHMTFSSGAGAWSTGLTLNSSGYFSGDYSDSDMGDIAEDHPNGVCYVCNFDGLFQITGTNTYAVELKLRALKAQCFVI
jgi:hypothetical protein